jgi:hypothetical protein
VIRLIYVELCLTKSYVFPGLSEVTAIAGWAGASRVYTRSALRMMRRHIDRISGIMLPRMMLTWFRGVFDISLRALRSSSDLGVHRWSRAQLEFGLDRFRPSDYENLRTTRGPVVGRPAELEPFRRPWPVIAM